MSTREIQLVSLHRNGKIGFFCLFEIKDEDGTEFLEDLGAIPLSLAAHLLSSLHRAKRSAGSPEDSWYTQTGGLAGLICICKVESEFIITKIWLEMVVKINYEIFSQYLNRILLKVCPDEQEQTESNPVCPTPVWKCHWRIPHSLTGGWNRLCHPLSLSVPATETGTA